MYKRNTDSVFRIRKEKRLSFNTAIGNNKKRKEIKFSLSNFHITKPYLQKISSLFLITTILFQSVAGSFLFSPVPQAKAAISWYNTDYSYRKQITIDRTKIPHTDTTNTNPYLTDFPILISLTDNNLKSVSNGGKAQKEDGSDIIFSNQAGTTLLNYEIESYEASTGTLVAWVKIPQLNDINNTQNTVIYMYYGNSAASANTQTNMQGVWDSNFKMVQHMNQTGTGAAGDYKDSTANSNNSINIANQPTVTAGKIGKAESFDGISSHIDYSTSNIINDITIEAWVYSALSQPTSPIVANFQSNSGKYYGYDFDIVNEQQLFFRYGNASNLIVSGKSNIGMQTNQWYHVVAAMDGFDVRFYVNGNFYGQFSRNDVISSSGYLCSVGWSRNNSNFFTGIIDEVRVSDVARSADWIKAESNNQSNPISFFILEEEENCSAFMSDATLSYLNMSVGSFSPSFSSEIGNYVDTVANNVDSINITPSAHAVGSTITINDIAVVSDTPSSDINLDIGTNNITIVVTAPDGITQKTYTVTINRRAALCDGGICSITTDRSGDFNCDGNADQVEINQAFVFAANNPGTIIHLEKDAVCVINDTVLIANNTTLEGDTGAKIKLADNVSWEEQKGMIQFVSGASHGIAIRGFEIDGNHGNQAALL